MNDMLNMGLKHFTLAGTSVCPEADLNGKAPLSHDFQLSSAKGCPSRRPEGGEERSQSISSSAPSRPGKGFGSGRSLSEATVPAPVELICHMAPPLNRVQQSCSLTFYLQHCLIP